MQPLFSDFATRQLKPWLLSAEHSPEIITLHNSSRSPARKVIWETAYQGGFGNCAAYRWKIATELRPCRWQNVSLTQNLVFATLETRRELKPKSSRNCLWDFGQFFPVLSRNSPTSLCLRLCLNSAQFPTRFSKVANMTTAWIETVYALILVIKAWLNEIWL